MLPRLPAVTLRGAAIREAGFFQTVGGHGRPRHRGDARSAEVVLRGQVEHGALGVALDARGALGR